MICVKRARKERRKAHVGDQKAVVIIGKERFSFMPIMPQHVDFIWEHQIYKGD